MNATHTPGKWEHNGTVVTDERDRIICDTDDGEIKLWEECLANAALIAAAPELLDCVRIGIAFVAANGSTTFLERFQNAIARAEGKAE